jgi:hypothetical protein
MLSQLFTRPLLEYSSRVTNSSQNAHPVPIWNSAAFRTKVVLLQKYWPDILILLMHRYFGVRRFLHAPKTGTVSAALLRIGDKPNEVPTLSSTSGRCSDRSFFLCIIVILKILGTTSRSRWTASTAVPFGFLPGQQLDDRAA